MTTLHVTPDSGCCNPLSGFVALDYISRGCWLLLLLSLLYRILLYNQLRDAQLTPDILLALLVCDVCVDASGSESSQNSGSERFVGVFEASCLATGWADNCSVSDVSL